jgi:hypothetical protein
VPIIKKKFNPSLIIDEIEYQSIILKYIELNRGLNVLDKMDWTKTILIGYNLNLLNESQIEFPIHGAPRNLLDDAFKDFKLGGTEFFGMTDGSAMFKGAICGIKGFLGSMGAHAFAVLNDKRNNYYWFYDGNDMAISFNTANDLFDTLKLWLTEYHKEYIKTNSVILASWYVEGM